MKEGVSHDPLSSKPELTEVQSIQLWIDKFYEINEHFNGDSNQFNRLRNIRNNIVNKMDSYLKKFSNKPIMKDFYGQLRQAKSDATINNMHNTYHQYFNEIRVVQEFNGMGESIAEKLAEQLLNQWREWSNDNLDGKGDC